MGAPTREGTPRRKAKGGADLTAEGALPRCRRRKDFKKKNERKADTDTLRGNPSKEEDGREGGEQNVRSQPRLNLTPAE